MDLQQFAFNSQSVRIANEQWKPIKGYEGIYEVSNYGDVRSFDRYVQCRGGKTRLSKGRVLSPVLVKGYLVVSLCLNGYQVEKKVHRLVANAFLSNPFEMPSINHLDGCKTNNNVSKLEFCTHTQNTKHAHANGLCDHVIGQNHYAAKLRNSDISVIRSRLLKGESPTDIAKDYSVGRHVIYKINSGKSWKSI
jgi:hypothetical protein